jgi:hypothetical protein
MEEGIAATVQPPPLDHWVFRRGREYTQDMVGREEFGKVRQWIRWAKI